MATLARGHDASAAAAGKVPASQTARFNAMLQRPENRICFDCDARQPRWASTNLGVFFCLRCAGIHRAMGVHISKVKSTNMDVWEDSMIAFIEHVGNARGKVLYEYNMPDGARARSCMDAHNTERLLRNKYERKAYYNPNFDAVLAQFMATPLEAEANTTTAQGGAPALSRPTRAGPVVPQPQAEHIEELWGASVVSAAPATPSPPLQQQPPPCSSTRMAVAELFATPLAPGPAASATHAPVWSQSPTSTSSSFQVWGSPNCSAPPFAAPPMYQHHHHPTHSLRAPSAHGVGDPAPMGQASRSNSDDLYMASPASHSGGGGGGDARSEILSLFSSAPVTGGGGGMTRAPVNAAWQPQVVRPYYHPQS